MLQMNRFLVFAIVAVVATALSGCGGGGSGGVRPEAVTGTEFADLNPTRAGYAATAAGRVASTRPRAGSVTQSSNSINGVTADRVTVTAEYGAAGNSYSVRNVLSWLRKHRIAEQWFFQGFRY